MEELKKSDKEVMEELRNAVIKKAIMVAASNHPMEFRNKRQKIAETLFSINSSSSSNDHVEQENIKVSDDPINQETEIEMAVLRIKEILDSQRDESESMVIYESLLKLQQMGMSYKTLEATKIGRSVATFKNHGSSDVRLIARRLVKTWKAVADEWFKKQQEKEENKPKDESIIKAKAAAAEKKQMVLKKESSTTTTSRSNVIKIKIINRINSDKKVAKVEDKSTTSINIENKLEATKRKLRQRYEEVENAKRQQKIQVVELDQLPKAINQTRKSLKSM